MEKFIRWLGAVGRRVDGELNVNISDRKIEINGYEYEFESPIEKRFAELLFSSNVVMEVESKVSRKKRKRKEEGESEE